MFMRRIAMCSGVIQRSALNPEEQGSEKDLHRQGRQ